MTRREHDDLRDLLADVADALDFAKPAVGVDGTATAHVVTRHPKIGARLIRRHLDQLNEPGT